MKRNTRQNPGNGSNETIPFEPSLTDPAMKLLHEVHKSQMFMSVQFDEFNKQIEDENKLLKAEVTCLRNRLAAVEMDNCALQQEIYRKYLYISGVPQVENENLNKIILDLASITNTNINNTNVISCRRDTTKSSKPNIHPQIVVELDTILTKDNFLANHKVHGPIFQQQINKNINNNNAKIYLNEYLSNMNKKLLYEAQQLKPKHNIKYVWTKNGNVYLRENDTSRIIRIKNLDQITNFRMRSE